MTPPPDGLPIDPVRLRLEFPSLDDGDLEAYGTVTRTVMADPLQRATRIREVMTMAETAREKAERGEPVSADEALAARYRAAVLKMQRRG